MIILELFVYFESMGGEDYKGLIIVFFIFMVGLFCFFSGWLIDIVGWVLVMVFGFMVCVVCSLFYFLVFGVVGFFWLWFFYGFFIGFKFMVFFVFVVDIVFLYCWGEVMGILGVSMNLGFFIFLLVGSWLVLAYFIDLMFYVFFGLVLFFILILMGMKEMLFEWQVFWLGLLRVGWKDFFEFIVVLLVIIIGLFYVCFGVLFIVVFDQVDYLGMANKGLFFISFIVMGLLFCLIVGCFFDWFGWEFVLQLFFIFIVGVLVFLGYVNSFLMLMVGVGVFGFCIGVFGLIVFVWVVD